MRYSKDNRINGIVEMLLSLVGWSVDSGGKHMCIHGPKGFKYAINRQSGDRRGALNWISALRRKLGELGMPEVAAQL